MVKLAISLDPSRSLYSSASTGPRSHHQSIRGLEDVELSSTARLVVPSLGSPLGGPLGPSNPVRPERSRPHHSCYDLCGCLHTIFPRAAIVLQKDHRGETVDARGFGGWSKTRREDPL